MGHHLVSYYDINNFDGRIACSGSSYAAGTPCNAAGFPTGFKSSRISTTIGADNFRTSAFNSNYHGLQMTLRRNYANGIGFQANYTYSKVLDTISDAFNFRTTNITDVQNIGYDYGPADFNLKHRFVATLVWDLPYMKQNRWIGGWSLSTAFSLQSGVPFSIYTTSTSGANDLNKDGRAGDRYVTVGGVAPLSTITGHEAANGYFTTTQWGRYACPATVNKGLWCDAPIGRNSMVGPGLWNDDLGITKRFKITERTSFSFSGNMFNVFNHANFATPGAYASSPSFGSSTAYARGTGPRVTQLSLRFDF